MKRRESEAVIERNSVIIKEMTAQGGQGYRERPVRQTGRIRNQTQQEYRRQALPGMRRHDC